MQKFRVGIDNYGLHPLNLDPQGILEWAVNAGAQGVAFSGLTPEHREKCNRSYLKDLKQYADTHDLYIEWGNGQHIPRNMTSWARKDLLDINRRAAEEAEQLNTRIIRSCSGGLMRWHRASPPTEELLRETAEELKVQKPMLKDSNVILAIETHFEFTTFELARLFEMCEAEPDDWLGICLDTMNLLTMLEEPVMATERILPYVVSTHFKDGGALVDRSGFKTYPAEIGRGVIDLKAILAQLGSLDRRVDLSIEDHGGEFILPVFDETFMQEFPDVTVQELAQLTRLASETQAKLDAGIFKLTKREDWGEICAERLARDIKALKQLVEQAA